MTLSNAHFVDCDKATGTSGSWTSGHQSRLTAYPQDYSHLEGQTVDTLQDGVDSTATISSGQPSPALTGSVNHVGLNYISTLIPSKLDLEGLGLLLTKKITKAIVSFYNTLKGKVGTARTETVGFGTELFEGIKEVPLHSGYEREGDITITQDKPLPMTCRGVVLDVGAHLK